MTFTGKLGNVIGYQRRGGYFLRSMPEIVHQTTATRRAAKRFGVASRRAALIRHAICPDLDIRCDSDHVNRLNKLLIKAAGNNNEMTGFRFNQHTGIDRFFSIAPELFRDSRLHLPPQDIACYKDVTSLEVKMIATRINFVTRQVTGRDTVVLMIDPVTPFHGADIPLDVPGNGALIVTLQVRGIQQHHVSSNRRYLAADIIAVMEQESPKRRYTRTYSQAHLALCYQDRHSCLYPPDNHSTGINPAPALCILKHPPIH